MRPHSVRTLVESGDIRRDHLLRPAIQMPVAKMHTVTEVDHLLQKVRPVGEALQNAGELSAVRIHLPPTGHRLGEGTGRFAFGSGLDEGHKDSVALGLSPIRFYGVASATVCGKTRGGR